MKSGTIKAVWIACTNPAQSLPNQPEVREALRAAEFVVLQETFANTDTAAYADLLLPATGWGEKHGTVTNSERRITHVNAAAMPVGEARHDWEIATDFARRLGRRLEHAAVDRLFPYTNVEEIFNEHRESTRGRDLDITGLSYAVLDRDGPQQWPYPEGATHGQVRLYADGVFPTADGRARFVPVEHLPTADVTSEAFPISLLSGRMRDHWHGMSRTGSVPRLFNIEDEPLIAMHPCDMRHRGLTDGDLARVSNARGSFVVRVTERRGLTKGRAWMPMHWGSQFMNSPGLNTVACDSTDPYSLQPELKHAAVQIAAAGLPYPVAILRRCEDHGAALVLLERARGLLAAYPYATVGLYGRSTPLVLFRAAAELPLSDNQLAELDALFEMTSVEGGMVYEDATRRVAKKAVVSDGSLVGIRLAGETIAQAWLKKAMAEDELDARLLRFALAPTATPPATIETRNIVCKCADVSDRQINDAIAAGLDLRQLQDSLKCGTFCGSCVPDIKRMVASHSEQHAAAA